MEGDLLLCLFVFEMRSLVDQVFLRCNRMMTLNSSGTSDSRVLGLWRGVCFDLGGGRKGGPCGPGEGRVQPPASLLSGLSIGALIKVRVLDRGEAGFPELGSHKAGSK